MRIADISDKIIKKIDDYYYSVACISNNPTFSWSFEPNIKISETTFDIFNDIDKLNEFLFTSGYEFELEIVYVNRFCLNEQNVRFIYGENVKEIAFKQENACLMNFSKGHKPIDFSDHIVFSIDSNSFYNEKQFKRLIIDYGLLLKKYKIDTETFSDLLLFLSEFKETAFQQSEILAFCYLLDECLDLSSKLTNILSIAYCKRPSIEVGELLITYKTKIGLPYIFKDLKEEELLFNPKYNEIIIELIGQFRETCQNWFISENLLGKMKSVYFNDILLNAEKTWSLLSQQEYPTDIVYIDSTSLKRFSNKYNKELDYFQSQLKKII